MQFFLQLNLDAKVSLNLLNELVLLDEALHVDGLVVGDFAQLLDAQLLEVGVLDVDFFLVPQLAHLCVLLLHARAQPLRVDATRKRSADVTLHTARRARLRVTNADVVALRCREGGCGKQPSALCALSLRPEVQ